MKDTTSIISSATLYAILLCGPTALTAEVGEGTHPVDRQQAPQAREAEHPKYMVLNLEQLDTVSAGTTVTCNRDGTGCVADPMATMCVMSTPVIVLGGIQFCSRP
jgi:hypothetical protein